MTLICQVLKFKRCSVTDTFFCSFLRREKRTPAFIRCQECCRLARSRHYKAKLAADEEHLHDIAVGNERTVLVRDTVVITASSVASSAAYASSCRAQPDYGQPTGRLPAAAVASL